MEVVSRATKKRISHKRHLKGIMMYLQIFINVLLFDGRHVVTVIADDGNDKGL